MVHLLREIEKFLRDEQVAAGPLRARGHGRSALRVRPAQRPRAAAADGRAGPRFLESGAMMKLAMSAAAAGLLRALLARAGSIAIGFCLRIPLGRLAIADLRRRAPRDRPAHSRPGRGAVAALLTDGLEDAEFAIPGQIVADIAVGRRRRRAAATAPSLEIEALTVGE